MKFPYRWARRARTKINILPDRSFPLPPSPLGVLLTGRGRACARPANTLEEIYMKVSVKVAGASGKISFGKEYAGRQALVQEAKPGGVDGSYCRSNPGQRTLAACARGGGGIVACSRMGQRKSGAGHRPEPQSDKEKVAAPGAHTARCAATSLPAAKLAAEIRTQLRPRCAECKDHH